MGSLWLWFALFPIVASQPAAYLRGRGRQPRQTRPLPNSRVDKFGTSKGYSPPILDVPPPAFVQDITGHAVELPRAVTAAQAQACVAAWGRLNATNLTVVGNRQTPFSTHAEDLTALRVVMTLRGARDAASLWSRGTFVELGAFDGVTESNSQLFERCLNWTGVLVEPNPRAWEALREHRAARPRAHLYHASPTCNESDDDATARIANHAYTSSALLAAGATRGGALVACTSMARVLRHARVDAIDVWSLDVEGSEADVLATVDFDAVRVSVLVVEAWNRECDADCPKRERVRAMLATAGYVRLDEPTVHKSDIFVPAGSRDVPGRLVKHAARARAEAQWLLPSAWVLVVAAWLLSFGGGGVCLGVYLVRRARNRELRNTSGVGA